MAGTPGTPLDNQPLNGGHYHLIDTG